LNYTHFKCFIPGIESFNADNLKKAETKEKLVLPAPEDIQVEKTIQGILHGVESFESDKLKSVKTREPLSPTAMIQVSIICSKRTGVMLDNSGTLFFKIVRTKNILPVRNCPQYTGKHIITMVPHEQNFFPQCLTSVLEDIVEQRSVV
jgi:Thymosin beta-4 family